MYLVAAYNILFSTIVLLPTPTAVAGRVFTFLPLFVCLSVFFWYDISKTDAARITKPDIEMFYDESYKLICFGVKRSKVKVTSHENCWRGFLHSYECWLLLVLLLLLIFSSLYT